MRIRHLSSSSLRGEFAFDGLFLHLSSARGEGHFGSDQEITLGRTTELDLVKLWAPPPKRKGNERNDRLVYEWNGHQS